MDPTKAYEELQQIQAKWKSGNIFVPVDVLRALLDGIDLDGADSAAQAADLIEVQEERDAWKAQDDRRTAQLNRLTNAYETAEQKLAAIKDLATQWRAETANRAVSAYDHDIKRAAELLLSIIR